MSMKCELFFSILFGRGDLHTTAQEIVNLRLIVNCVISTLGLMRWLRFFVVVFRDIYWFAVDNCYYLPKKYELLINLNLYVN